MFAVEVCGSMFGPSRGVKECGLSNRGSTTWKVLGRTQVDDER